MKATEDLIHEHNAVLVALKILEKVAAAIAAKSEQAPAHLEQLVDFFKGFVDKCHHGKEEDALFPELERRVVRGHNREIRTPVRRFKASYDRNPHQQQLGCYHRHAARALTKNGMPRNG